MQNPLDTGIPFHFTPKKQTCTGADIDPFLLKFWDISEGQFGL
jgi:hypothetical protein